MRKIIRVAICLLVTMALCYFLPKDSNSGDYEEYLKSQKEAFQSYKDERDAEFIGFLKEQWKEYNMSKGLVRDDKPKPRLLPVAAAPSAAPVLPKKMKIVKSIELPMPKPVDIIKEKIDDKPIVKPSEKPLVVVKEKPVAIIEKPWVKPSEDKPIETIEKPVTSPSVKPFEKVIETPIQKPAEKPAIKTEPKFVDKPKSSDDKPLETAMAKPIGKPIDNKPVPQIPVKIDTRKPGLKIDFYMMPISIYGKYDFPQMDGNAVNKEMIASFWDKMSQLDYDSFIAQVKKYKTDMKLNDWGYHYILYRLGMERYRGNKNMANLFTWYMSSKSGYESRIGYNDTQVFLLMPSKNNLYSIPFLTLNNKKYYSLFFDDQPSKFKTLYTYQGSYPEAKKVMDFDIRTAPEIPKIMKQKNLAFDLNKKNVEVSAIYNKNIVDFFKYYPQTNIKVYFDSFMSPDLEYALLLSLKPMVEGKTEAEAVNNLLRFVQKAFAYKTDDGQFGHEKYMLPEETVFYPYSDCEDRSFFFAYLVRKLVKLEVVGLDYPGHVATGVKFSDNLPGDFVIGNNSKYMVCDPTYINATLGMAMPQFKKTKPDIIQIK